MAILYMPLQGTACAVQGSLWLLSGGMHWGQQGKEGAGYLGHQGPAAC